MRIISWLICLIWFFGSVGTVESNCAEARRVCRGEAVAQYKVGTAQCASTLADTELWCAENQLAGVQSCQTFYPCVQVFKSQFLDCLHDGKLANRICEKTARGDMKANRRACSPSNLAPCQ